MNLVALRTMLRKMVGNPSVTDAPEADLNDRLNEAYKELTVKYKSYKGRKLCTFPTVAGQEHYDLPTDCYAVLRLRDTTNNVRIKPFRSDESFAARDTTTPNGKPEKYFRHRNFVSLFPIPDAVYTIEEYYSAVPVDLSDDADVPVIPEPWHIGICRLARYLYRDLEGDDPKAVSALTSFNRWLESMPTEVEIESEFRDVGVEIATLSEPTRRELDWDHSDDNEGSRGGFG